MKHFLRCDGENSQAIELAIETVGRANDDQLTHELVNFLMGDTDGVPKVRGYSIYNFLLLFLSKNGFNISFQPLFGWALVPAPFKLAWTMFRKSCCTAPGVGVGIASANVKVLRQSF